MSRLLRRTALLAATVAGLHAPLHAQRAAAAPLLDLYPLITTPHLSAVRDFYVTSLGFTVLFEAQWFVLLGGPGNAARTLAFMSPDHPSRPPGPEAFSGQGMLLTLQVADAKAECERLRARGVRLVHPVTDEPWGQRRCALRDPAGVLVDIV
ncbi:MAG: VOC family protein, partial [Gemmatimonadaceae bacterium]|nr:VOC family protein [Gemmatimonadaceae bacterium]